MTISASLKAVARESNNSGELPEGWTLTTIGIAYELNPPKVPKDELPGTALVTFVPMSAARGRR